MSILRQRIAFALLIIAGLVTPAKAQIKHPQELHVGFDTLYASDVTSLYRVDLQTGHSAKIADFSEMVYSIASDPIRGILYGLVAGEHGTDLARISPHTGAIRHIGALGTTALFLAYNPVSNLLYGLAPESPGVGQFMTINPATGASTSIAPLGGYGPIIAIAFDMQGNFYSTSYAGDPREHPGYLFQKTPTSPQSTGFLTVTPIPLGFTFDRWNTLYGVDENFALYAYQWGGGEFTGTLIASQIPSRSLAFLPGLTP